MANCTCKHTEIHIKVDVSRGVLQENQDQVILICLWLLPAPQWRKMEGKRRKAAGVYVCVCVRVMVGLFYYCILRRPTVKHIHITVV